MKLIYDPEADTARIHLLDELSSDPAASSDWEKPSKIG